MRKPAGTYFLFLLSISLVSLPHASGGDVTAGTVGLQREANRFLSHLNAPPLIFIGKIVAADRKRHRCTVSTWIPVTFSVEKVLFGFSPGDQIKVAYSSCGLSDRRFSSSGDRLVFARENSETSTDQAWTGSLSLLLPPTELSQRMVRGVVKSYLDAQIAKFRGHHTNEKALVFMGTITDPGPQPQGPVICKSQASFSVKFEVNEIVWGDWPTKTVVARFGACAPLPDPPIGLGQRMIVFARVGRRQTEVYRDLPLLLPPDEKNRVISYFPVAEH